MSSPEPAQATGPGTGAAAPADLDSLPPALRSMWRLCMLGYRYEPSLMGVALVLTLVAAVPDALVAVWFKLLGEGVLEHKTGLLWTAAFGMAGSAVLTWFLSTVSTRLQRRFRDKVTIALESHVARLQATIPTISHQERPEYLDRLSVLREQTYVLDHMYMSVFSTVGWLLRLGVTVAILATVNPLLILLVAFALPTVAATSWRPGVERQAQEGGAQADRLARHLFSLTTTASPGKELRVLGIAAGLARRRREAWEEWYGPVAGARSVSSLWYAAGWAIFGAAYVGAIILVATGRHASAPNVLLVLAAGARLSSYVGATVSEIGFLRGIWMDGARRLAWLEDYASAITAASDLDVPERLKEGIRFEHVSFTYPGASTPALEDVNLLLPAGSVVAVVGENGAGKSTLAKLIAKLYAPTSGRILVDDCDLARLRTEEWRARLAGAFQDFFRFELLVSQTIGLGDLSRIEEEPALTMALERAGASDVVATMPSGLGTQLGKTWNDGIEVSFGQWQKLALARGFMRDSPHVAILDEPTAALDAETEHALFERYASRVRGSRGKGGITILVSHRFSTLQMADLIVVLDGSRVVEVGTHDDLMARNGQYSQLYRIQAEAYR